MKKLVIAEKPSLAEAIAQAYGKILNIRPSKNTGGFWDLGDLRVTWLFGHMYGLADPAEQDPKYQSWSVLPVIPDKWILKASPDKAQHLSNIKSLLKWTDEVINAGDAGREGQLLVDELLFEMGWNPFSDKTRRIWVSSVAEKDLVKAIQDIFPNSDKKNLYDTALCRQRSDYMHGMTFTRFYTTQAKKQGFGSVLLTVGRVQSPVLKLIADRDRTIEKFKPVNFYLPTGHFTHGKGKFKADLIISEDMNGLDEEGRLTSKSVADDITTKCTGKQGTVTAFNSTRKNQSAPLPFNLSALQTECSAKFGLSAKDTLKVAQALYETHKVTTYPRTDSRYLGEALKEQIPAVMKALTGTAYGPIVQQADHGHSSEVWNDSKVSDHHGIIPTTECTDNKLSQLSDIEKKVFDLIARNYLAQFFTSFKFNALSATIKIDKYDFKATGRQIIEEGWRVVFDKNVQNVGDEETGEEEQSLPIMNDNDKVSVDKIENPTKKTKPPSRFTDGSLIDGMKNIHRFVQNENVKKKLKENSGLGTEATRADIIEGLITKKYVERKGKNQIISTELGRSLVDNLLPDLTDPGITALWEEALNQVETGNLTLEKYLNGAIKSINEKLEKLDGGKLEIKGANSNAPKHKGHGETCPKCNKGIMISAVSKKGAAYLYCNNKPACEHYAFPPSDKPEIKPIEGHGKTCPTCKKGKMLTREIKQGPKAGEKFLACSEKDCKGVEWQKTKQIARR